MHTTETGATRPDAVLELLEPDEASYIRATTAARDAEFEAGLRHDHREGLHDRQPYSTCTLCILDRGCA